ncbi:hypothetical protein [Leucobacter chromiiresistens]|nr:hypothetical protein [Leucobacter chromiiresistens]
MSRDELDRLAVREHAAFKLHQEQAWPVPSPEYVTAKKGLDDLVTRKGWNGLSRDDRRLRAKYQATLKAHEVTAVQHAHALGLLDAKHLAAAVRLGLLNNE